MGFATKSIIKIVYKVTFFFEVAEFYFFCLIRCYSYEINLKFQRKFNEDPLSTNTAQQLNVSWTLVSKEFNKEVQELRFFRTEKQCKERWFNHLSPVLKKYLIKSS